MTGEAQDATIRRSAAAPRVRAERRIAAALLAALLGVFLLYGVGFAQPQFLHEAAHDSRHSLSFPCH